MLKTLMGATIFFLAACAQQSVITHVNQRPIFQPSLISYAARHGAVPIEIFGALPAGMTAQEIAQAVNLPGRTEGVRLITDGKAGHPAPASADNPVALIQDRLQAMIGTAGHNFRIVLVFGPHFQTLPDRACDAADKIPASGGQDVRVMAAFCIGTHLAASGQVRVPTTAVTPAGVTGAINLLLSDMSKPQPSSGRDSDGGRRR